MEQDCLIREISEHWEKKYRGILGLFFLFNGISNFAVFALSAGAVKYTHYFPAVGQYPPTDNTLYDTKKW